jgi:hypothetical protein
MQFRAASIACLALATAFGCANAGQVLNDALAMALAAPRAGGSLIQNGGFEAPVVASGSYQLFAGGQSFAGWQVIGVPRGNVAPISGGYRNAGITFNAHSGAQWLDLTGLTNSANGVQQTVRTRAGARYELSFFIGNVSGGGFGTTSAVEVLIDQRSVGVFRNDRVQPGAQHWRRIAIPITASSAATAVAFINRDAANDNSNGLDDVALVEVETANAPSSLSGDYEYLGQGRCSVTQTGANVRMLCTWAPAGRGPHYEIRGTLAGNTITGEWYSLYAKKGWYRYVGRVQPDGSIEQSQSDDPIRSNLKTAVLTRVQ